MKPESKLFCDTDLLSMISHQSKRRNQPMNTVDYFEKGPTEIKQPIAFHPRVPIRIEQINFKYSNVIAFYSFDKYFYSEPKESTVAFFHVTPINIQP
jgi:hypothetical protein